MKHLLQESFFIEKKIPFKIIPLRFRKAGRLWCGGARETHWATCHNRVTPSKTKEFLESPCFLILIITFFKPGTWCLFYFGLKFFPWPNEFRFLTPVFLWIRITEQIRHRLSLFKNCHKYGSEINSSEITAIFETSDSLDFWVKIFYCVWSLLF